MKLLVGIFFICYFVQSATSNPSSFEPYHKGLLDKRAYGSGTATNSFGRFGILTSVAESLRLDTIISSLQGVVFDAERFVGDSLSALGNLSECVNGAFAGISSTTKSLGKVVKEIVGSVDKAVGGVNSAIIALIDSIVALTSATARQLTNSIDKALKLIIQTILKLVAAVKDISKSIQNIQSNIAQALQSIFKSTLIVSLNSLKTISGSLNKLNTFVPVLLSTVVQKLDEQITDFDVSLPIDIDAIVRDLQNCSEGTVVNVEIVDRTLDGSTGRVDVVFTAISCSPPLDGRWQIPLDGLRSVCERSFEEIVCTIESVTETFPGWGQRLISAVSNVARVTENLITTAISATNGNDEDLEAIIRNLADAIRRNLVALDYVASAANLQSNELESNTLKSAELAVQSVISNANDALMAVSIAVNVRLSSASVLSELIATLDAAIYGSSTELLLLLPVLDEICKN